MEELLDAIKLMAAGVGGVAGLFIGDINGLMIALLLFMGIDYLTGVAAALKDRRLSSAVGFWGIVKKICLVTVVGVGNVIDVYILGDGAVFRTAAIFFFLANEGISMTENFAAIGVLVPEEMKAFLAQLKEKE